MPADTFQFLVVGAGRGGTSLLAGLLDYHESLEVKFEHFSEGYLAGVALTAPGPDIFEARVKAFVRACRDEAAQYPARSRKRARIRCISAWTTSRTTSN